MDINRRDFTKFLGALGAGAMVSPSVLHAALPSTKTVVAAKPLITSIGMSTVFNMPEIGELATWSEAEGFVETVVDYSLENGDAYTLTFSGGEKIWCEEHNPSINEPSITCTAVSDDGESTTTTKVDLNVYEGEAATPITELEIGQHYDLDLIILVINKPGQHAWNHIMQNNSYRVLVKNTPLVSKILERGGNENDI
jgi:hypothetical protein